MHASLISVQKQHSIIGRDTAAILQKKYGLKRCNDTGACWWEARKQDGGSGDNDYDNDYGNDAKATK